MKLILVGKAAAGKDFLKNRLAKKGFVSGISHTTRPPRETEVNHQDYHFVDKEEFEAMIECGEFIEYMEFNGWYYGQTKKDFDLADVMIMSKDGLDVLPQEYRDQCMVIYLDPPRLTRIDRLTHRNRLETIPTKLLKIDKETHTNKQHS